MTHTRPTNIQQHRARPAPAAAPAQTEENEEEKIEYIDFINRLMHRMKMDGIKRMLEAALNELK